MSIIIPTRGADDVLKRCIGSLLEKTEYTSYEILIINNGDRRPEDFTYFEEISAHAGVSVIHYDAPFNYSAVNNFGARHARGDLLLFLNNDTEIITTDWLDELVLWTERAEVGVVGAKLLHPKGTIQHAGVIIGLTGFAGHVFAGAQEAGGGIFGLDTWYRNYVAVTGACMMMRRDVFDQVRGFDEEFMLCGSDVDICLRARRPGYRIICNPFARLLHIESATHRGAIPAKDFLISYERYRSVLELGDPYFNSNLSYWDPIPALKRLGEPSPLEFVTQHVRQSSGSISGVERSAAL